MNAFGVRAKRRELQGEGRLRLRAAGQSSRDGTLERAVAQNLDDGEQDGDEAGV